MIMDSKIKVMGRLDTRLKTSMNIRPDVDVGSSFYTNVVNIEMAV